MAGEEREPSKRKRGTKHQQRRSRTQHTPGRDRPIADRNGYVEELIQFTPDQYAYLMGYFRNRSRSLTTNNERVYVATTRGFFDEASDQYQDD